MTNLENIKQFVLEADVETINEFIGEPLAINIDRNANEVNEDVLEFINRLASKIRQQNKSEIFFTKLLNKLGH